MDTKDADRRTHNSPKVYLYGALKCYEAESEDFQSCITMMKCEYIIMTPKPSDSL